MYVYIQSEPGLFTVGFYDPAARWHPDADFDTREEARQRVAFLNGAYDVAARRDAILEGNL